MDQFARSLFLTARVTIEANGGCSGMLLATKDDTEKIVLILSDKGSKEEQLIRYDLALVLCLLCGVDRVYEMRDAFVVSTNDLTPLTVPPSEDPAAKNAVIVVSTTIATATSTFYMQPYTITDSGAPAFSDIAEQGTTEASIEGRLGPLLPQAIALWRKTGAKILPPDDIDRMRRYIGFLGRVAGSTPTPP